MNPMIAGGKGRGRRQGEEEEKEKGEEEKRWQLRTLYLVQKIKNISDTWNMKNLSVPDLHNEEC